MLRETPKLSRGATTVKFMISSFFYLYIQCNTIFEIQHKDFGDAWEQKLTLQKAVAPILFLVYVAFRNKLYLLCLDSCGYAFYLPLPFLYSNKTRYDYSRQFGKKIVQKPLE